jgi:hypothetical protein
MKFINANGAQAYKIYTGSFRRVLTKLIGLLAIGMGLWISACEHSNRNISCVSAGS